MGGEELIFKASNHFLTKFKEIIAQNHNMLHLPITLLECELKGV
jgi:hypothetical protein